jgi:hypothetical protein
VLTTSIIRVLISLIIEAVNTSETSVNLYISTQRNIPKGFNLHAQPLRHMQVTWPIRLLLRCKGLGLEVCFGVNNWRFVGDRIWNVTQTAVTLCAYRNWMSKAISVINTWPRPTIFASEQVPPLKCAKRDAYSCRKHEVNIKDGHKLSWISPISLQNRT